MESMYGVASETSTVARSRRPGQGIGPRRIAKAPGPVAHALTADGRSLCGADVSDLIRWSEFDFGEVDAHARCPACAGRAGVRR
jgi:hypothetical protein